MISKKYIIFCCITACSVFLACKSNNDEEKLLAKVGKEKLYLSDVFFPQKVSSIDSANFIKLKIGNWIMDQLVYNQAINELSEKTKNEIEKKNKKNILSLYVLAQEENIITKSKNKNISAADANKYYNDNADEFRLTENIVKVIYVKIPKKNNNEADIFRKLMKSDKPEDKAELLQKASKKALNYFLEDNVWLNFNDILKEIPIKTENQEAFLKANSFYETKTDSVIYLVHFSDYMLINSPAPFAMVKERIEQTIQAKQRNQIITKYRNNLYQNALNNKEITIYLN